jgi:opacity protein-like surface antigen
MTHTRSLVFAIAVLSAPTLTWAQGPPSDGWAPEVSIGAGLGHVFRYEDQAFGDRLNIGGGAAIVYRDRFAIELEIDRTAGLTPRQVPCSVVGVTCVGSGRDGPLSAAVRSLNVQYRFKRGRRMQPFLVAGFGTLWTTSLHSITHAGGAVATISEFESRDRGFGPDLGAGLRIALTRRLAVSPEIRWLDAPWMGAANLAVTRLSLRTSFH